MLSWQRIFWAVVAVTSSKSTSAFTGRSPQTFASQNARFDTSAQAGKKPDGENLGKCAVCRRSALVAGTASIAAMFTSLFSPQDAVADPENSNAFNSLTFNYRGSDYGGLDASTLNEPSVSYKEFLDKLSAGDVEYVEFIAPDGDAAYVTFKAKEGESKQSPIRIGDGYPIEKHDGWSSPLFVVRSVKNKGVPYKFSVPALASYK